MTSQPGLRDRKKAATRAALSREAVRIALDKGLDSVTVEAIAEAADVSPRTFHNYFARKEDALIFHVDSIMSEWADDLRSRPESESLWDALEQVVLSQVVHSERDLREIYAVTTMIDSNPNMMANQTAMWDRAESNFRRAIADRTGADPEKDLYPRLVHLAATAAAKAALELWFSDRSQDVGIEQMIAEAFEMLRAGLPDPRTSGRP